MSDFLKCECPHCGLHIEFAATHGGRQTECPQCQHPFQLPVATAKLIQSEPPPMPPNTTSYAGAAQSSLEQPQVRYGKIQKSETAVYGCLTLGVAVLLLLAFFWFPISTIIGLILLFVGSAQYSKRVCSECGTTLSSNPVKLCPGCKAEFL